MPAMEQKESHIRPKKPFINLFLLLVALLLAAALLFFGCALVQKQLMLTRLEVELAAAQEDFRTTYEELQQVRTAMDSLPAAPEPSQLPFVPSEPLNARSAPEILAETSVIAHAMGAVNYGGSYYNSLEAFESAYAAGMRVFEVDLALTRDGKAVLLHDWGAWQRALGRSGDPGIPTLEEFLATPAYKGHTPLSFRDLLCLMAQYPDICVITDSKYTDQEMVLLQFTSMLADAEELGLTNLFDRIIIQLYNQEMRQYLDTLYPFPHFIYTLYKEGKPTSSSFPDTVAYCAETGVLGITMRNSWWNDSFAPVAEESGVAVFVHTENDIDAARGFLEHGVSAIYTDHLTPDNFTDK